MNPTNRNTWRDNLAVWALTPAVALVLVLALALIFIEAGWQDRGRA